MWRRMLLIEDHDRAVSRLLDDRWLNGQRIRCESAAWTSRDMSAHARAIGQLLVLAPPLHKTTPSQLLSFIEARCANVPVLVILPEGAPAEWIEAVAHRADDFLIWRADRVDVLHDRILRLIDRGEVAAATRQLTEKLALSRLIGSDPAFVAMLQKVPLFARSGSNVLILGETGTGKELCARAIHHLSPRSAMPFIPVDCAALPEQLVENELFGHLRGAFTDAHRDRTGLLHMAQGGTLFLDEVDSLALPAQAKILRLLEERTFRPLGSSRFLQADIRVVAATNNQLEPLVAERRFRADLYFRLNVLCLRVPALRERPNDVVVLARHFADQICAEAGIATKTFERESLDKLAHAPWPGNVRQLFNVIQAAVVLSEGPEILARHLPGGDGVAAVTRPPVTFNEAKAHAIAQFEQSYVRALMCKHAGNVTKSALEAKKDRRAIGRLIKKHHIDRLAR